MVEGSALFNVLRHFGSVVLDTLSINVQVYGTQYSYFHLRDWVSPFNELFGLSTVAGSWSVATKEGIAVLNDEVLRQATMIGYINSFYLFGLTAALSVPLVLLFRRPQAAQN